METYKSKETSFRDYLRIIFRYKIIFLIFPIALLIPVYTSMELKTPIYGAAVKMYLGGSKTTEANYYRDVAVGNPVEPHIELVKSNIVLERVVDALKLYQIPFDDERQYASKLRAVLLEYRNRKFKEVLLEMPAEQKNAYLYNSAMARLRGNISASPSNAMRFFNILVKDFNPERAVTIANSVSRSYVIYDLEQQIAELKLEYGDKHMTVKKLENYIDEFRKTLNGKLLSDIEAIGPASIKIADQAKVALPFQELNKSFKLALSFVLGLFFSGILSFVLDYFDQTFRSPQDIERFLKIRFLGSIPRIKRKDKRVISDLNPAAAPMVRSYQIITDQTLMLMQHNNIKSIIITDIEGSLENAVVIANIGTSLALNGENTVLMIDANLRQSHLSTVLGFSDSPGLHEVVDGEVLFEETVQHLGTNLYLLPSGKPVLNPHDILNSQKISDTIKLAHENFGLIIISCTGINNHTDVTILSSVADGVALIINEGKVRRQVIEEAIAPLNKRAVTILGAILNDRRYVIPEIIYKLI